jgi:transcriptional regulator with XRE-family HTH domain
LSMPDRPGIIPRRRPAVLDIGRRIAGARRRRGMSRKVLADLVGRSQEWLRLVETGQRPLNSIQIANRLTEILDLEDLGLSRPSIGGTHWKAGHGTAAIRRSMLDAMPVQAFANEQAWRESAEQLEVDVQEAWRRWLAGRHRYQDTLQILPGLTRGATWRLQGIRNGHAGPIDAAMLALYLVRTVMSRVGEETLAWLAADRAMNAAAFAGASLPLLSSSWHVCVCYLRHGYREEALQFALAAVDNLAEATGDGRDAFILRGALKLLAAEAAASLLDAHRAHELLAEARDAAEVTGDDTQAYMIPFGPTEVGITAVQMAARLGRSTEAIRLASQVEVLDTYPPDRQARYYIPLANLYAQRKEDAAAVLILKKVAAVSPEDIRYDYLSRDTLVRLLGRNNLTVHRDVLKLAQMAGILTPTPQRAEACGRGEPVA